MTKTALQQEREYFLTLLEGLSDNEWRGSTLCEGWTVEDLAAHMVVREHGDFKSRLGILVQKYDRYHQSAIKNIEGRGRKKLVHKLNHGPWWVTHLGFNIVEHYVHNEDILRGELGRKRTIAPEVEKALARITPIVTRLQWGRRPPANIKMVSDGAKKLFKVGRGTAQLTIAGRPGEVLLLALGRGRQATIKLEGPVSMQEQLKKSW